MRKEFDTSSKLRLSWTKLCRLRPKHTQQMVQQRKSWKMVATIATICRSALLSNQANIGNRILWDCTICTLGQNIHCLPRNTHSEHILMNTLTRKAHSQKPKSHFSTGCSCYRKARNSFGSLMRIAHMSCNLCTKWNLWDMFRCIHFGIQSSFTCMRSIFHLLHPQSSKGRTFDSGSWKLERGKCMRWTEWKRVRFQCNLCEKVWRWGWNPWIG